jgi:hypothetical protein
MTRSVVSNALLGKICGLEDVHTAARVLDGRTVIFCALALRRLRHVGAVVVGGTRCGCCEGVWYASGWKVAKRCAVWVWCMRNYCAGEVTAKFML